MKIAYVTEFIDLAGGIERGLIHRANYLVEKHSFDITIFCTNKLSGIPFYEINPKIQIVFLEPLTARTSFIGRIIMQYKQAKLIVESKPNTIISLKYSLHNLFFHLIRSDQKLISELRESKDLHYRNNNTLKSKFYNFIRKEIFKKQDVVITLTKQDVEKWGLRNMDYVYNSQMISSMEVSALDYKQVLCVGRLEEIKGHKYLIEAWEKVQKVFPDWKLKICGEGSEYDNLKKQITELKLADTVIISNKSVEVIPEYLSSSIFVLTSLYEAFGNVIVEAQTFGLPVVSFDSPYGPKEIINDNKDGFIIPLYDIENFAKKIILLIQNDDLRYEMSRNAVINSKRFDLTAIMKKYIRLIS